MTNCLVAHTHTPPLRASLWDHEQTEDGMQPMQRSSGVEVLPQREVVREFITGTPSDARGAQQLVSACACQAAWPDKPSHLQRHTRS
jgi:hypothetical protein